MQNNKTNESASKPLFGEWLSCSAKGIGLRLLIEEMNETSPAVSVAEVQLLTNPDVQAKINFSSGEPGFPWTADPDDSSPGITWTFPEKVDMLSLTVKQTDPTKWDSAAIHHSQQRTNDSSQTSCWIRRYRVEVTEDNRTWKVIVPSTLINFSFHGV